MRNGAAGRLGAIVSAGAIVVAPFIALLFRAEAGLVVMAIALGALSMLLREALDAAPLRSQRWLRLVMIGNYSLATACLALAAWLVARG